MRGSGIFMRVAPLLALLGCASAQTVPVTTVDCLSQTYVAYTSAQQQAAAAELEKLGLKSEVAKMMTDYGKTRAAQRACSGRK